MLSHDAGDAVGAAEKKISGWRGVRMISKNHRFLVFLVCIVAPTNILMAAYLWYLVPLYLYDLGATAAEIGRTIMIYYMLIYAIGETVSKKVKTMNGLILLMGLGSLLSGIGLVAFHRWNHFWAVFLSVAILGLSHSLIKAPQIALSLEICRADVHGAGHTIVLSALRLLERLGSIIGLIIGAVMIELYGYQDTIGVAGIAVCVASLTFTLFFFITRNHDTVRLR